MLIKHTPSGVFHLPRKLYAFLDDMLEYQFWPGYPSLATPVNNKAVFQA